MLFSFHQRQPGEWEIGHLMQARGNTGGRAAPYLRTGAFIKPRFPISLLERNQGILGYQALSLAYMGNALERKVIFIKEPHFRSRFHRPGGSCSVSKGNLFYTRVRFLQGQVRAVQCIERSGMATGLLVESRGFQHR